MADLTLRAMNCSERLLGSVVGRVGREAMGVLWFVAWSMEHTGCTYLVGLLQDDTALAVANDNPVNLGVLQLLDADLAGESTVGLVEDVLGSDADLGVGQAAGEGEVEGRGRDDDLGVGVELGGVEVIHDVGDALSNTVPVLLVNWEGLECRDTGA